MTEPASVAKALAWDLLIKKRGSATQGVPAGRDDLKWVANTVMLFYGERDAVLVDTFLSLEHTGELADWIETFGRNLTTIDITHGYPDHFFGLKLLRGGIPWRMLPPCFPPRQTSVDGSPPSVTTTCGRR